MVNSRDNRGFSVQDGRLGRSASGRSSFDTAATGDLSEAARRLNANRSSSRSRSAAGRGKRGASAGDAKVPSRSSRTAATRSTGAAHGATSQTERLDAAQARSASARRTGGGRGRQTASQAGRAGARETAPSLSERAATRDSAGSASDRGRSSRVSSLMRYASDNRAVQAINTLLTGPFRYAFYAVIIAAVALGLYFPIRDLYIAHRTNTILTEQLAIREQYNESLQKKVDSYLSNEGIEDAARKELGMVKEGERRIIVTGTDKDGNPITSTDGSGSSSTESGADGTSSDDASSGTDASGATTNGASNSSDSSSSADSTGSSSADSSSSDSDSAGSTQDSAPTTSAEVERAMENVYASSPWYYKILDAVFFFHGVAGQTVTSTGTSDSSTGN